jgi:osmotically-inducible protein OsmY
LTSVLRLAGVLAWWVPGCRDVGNSLGVVLAVDDNDALRLVLEIDPFIQSDQITASCRNYVVTLEGFIRTDEERRRAELEA